MLFITELSKVWWPWIIGGVTSSNDGSILLEGLGSEGVMLANRRRSRYEQKAILRLSSSTIKRRRRLTRRNGRVISTQNEGMTKPFHKGTCAANTSRTTQRRRNGTDGSGNVTRRKRHKRHDMIQNNIEMSQNKESSMMMCEQRRQSLSSSRYTAGSLLLSNVCYWCCVGIPLWVMSTTIYALAFALIGIQTCLLALCFVIWLQMDFILVMRHLCFFMGSFVILYKPRMLRFMASLFIATIFISLIIILHQFEGLAILKRTLLGNNTVWGVDRNNTLQLMNHFLLPKNGLWQTM